MAINFNEATYFAVFIYLSGVTANPFSSCKFCRSRRHAKVLNLGCRVLWPEMRFSKWRTSWGSARLPDCGNGCCCCKTRCLYASFDVHWPEVVGWQQRMSCWSICVTCTYEIIVMAWLPNTCSILPLSHCFVPRSQRSTTKFGILGWGFGCMRKPCMLYQMGHQGVFQIFELLLQIWKVQLSASTDLIARIELQKIDFGRCTGAVQNEA